MSTRKSILFHSQSDDFTQRLTFCGQLIWFLTPTVALAEQQYSVISKQLPLYQSRLLLGSDNVDHWSTQNIWDRILLNIRIAVSTPQVLLDAMCHGFVKLSGLSLLIFDEGECTSKIHHLYRPELTSYQHIDVSRTVPSMASCVSTITLEIRG